MHELSLTLHDYDLPATLASGQAFGWREREGRWEAVLSGRWVGLHLEDSQLLARTLSHPDDWSWLKHYLQTDVILAEILRTFPQDDVLPLSVQACAGLRLLRQDPWECLASFILSSTKQIVQIQQIRDLLCSRYGTPVEAPVDALLSHSFPTAERLAAVSEKELRDCKMGFRAPSLLQAAQAVVEGRLDLAALGKLSLEEARAQLCSLRGVGPKIADCVLLFAYGFPNAFPVDVWVFKALQQLYFPKRRASKARLERFIRSHFGPHSGYAQQYLFHYMRTKRVSPSANHRPAAS